MENTSLGDRMKLYESREAGRVFMPLLPVVARLDGRSFSKLTKPLERPFDPRMTRSMQFTTKKLLEETGADIGYTQSDEISLVWVNDSNRSQIFFNGKIQKMVSVLASLCSVHFNYYGRRFTPEIMVDKTPVFDCRVYQTPNLMEAYNALIWREQDAKRNSIQMAARARFSHNQCDRKNCNELQEMLFQEGINWNDYPPEFKRGSYFAKRKVIRVFSEAERSVLPDKHPAKADPSFVVERSEVQQLDLPPMSGVLNKVEVYRDGAEPLFEVVNEEQKVNT